MRPVVIIDNGEVQIDLIPETDADIAALAMIAPGTLLRAGKGSGYAPVRGNYLRPYGDDGSVKFTFLTTVGESGSDEVAAP